MSKSIEIYNEKGEKQDISIEFAFHCERNNLNYIAVNNHDEIFEPTSRYANLDIFKIVKQKNTYIYISDIPNNEWEIVKQTLQYEIFAKK